MMPVALLNHPMVTQEQWQNFTVEDHHTWQILFDRQVALLQQRASVEILEGLKKLAICQDHIPKFTDLNAILKQTTGFSIVPVKGFIPEDLFFHFLAQRKFPATCFIRKPQQLDYLAEPDIFHDVFGHIPLLVNPIFADFMALFGCKGLAAIEAGMLQFAAALYWFTVEFGLIQSPAGLRIYGAGITSSQGESLYCLDSIVPKRLAFDLLQVMQTPYATDAFQTIYFVIKDFQQLFDALHQLDWQALSNTCIVSPTKDA